MGDYYKLVGKLAVKVERQRARKKAEKARGRPNP
jgi:hypothetical protein